MIDPYLRVAPPLVLHPIHAMLLPFPFVCFVGTLMTDLTYWATASTQWETFSIWLLTVGLVMAGFSILAAIVDYVATRRRGLLPTWPHVLGTIVAIALSVVNAFVHSRDGYTAVVPQGLILSGLVVVILVVSNWHGWSIAYRRQVEVVQ